jgi:hypothetical protein
LKYPSSAILGDPNALPRAHSRLRTRRAAEGKSKPDIIRCLKRYVIREVNQLIKVNLKTGEIAA